MHQMLIILAAAIIFHSVNTCKYLEGVWLHKVQNTVYRAEQADGIIKFNLEKRV